LVSSVGEPLKGSAAESQPDDDAHYDC